MALLLVTAGVLLGFVEFNRPGSVLPGACGLLLLLLGAHRLATLCRSAPAGALWLGAGGLVCLGVLRWRQWHGVPGAVGTGALTGALTLLARHSGGKIPMALAAGCGLLLGGVASSLMTVAGHAWRAKSGHRAASAERAQTGAAEWWGVD